MFPGFTVALAGIACASGALAADPAPESAPTVAAAIARLQSAAEASNLGLAQASLEIEKGEAALDAARARFLPEVTLNARYTRAQGGRQLTVPVGQLINPAYQALNELLVANGGTPRFPQLGDESFPLQLPREQDTRISLRQPLYAPAVPAANAAAAAAGDAARHGREAFRLGLRRDVAIGYLEWLRAQDAVAIITAGEALLAENLRVQRSLHAQGTVTRDAVLRAEAEWLAVQQQRLEATSGAHQAARYVNFLLNRPLDTALEAARLPEGRPDAGTQGAADAATAGAVASARRPELLQLDAAVRSADAQLRVAQAARKPTLALGIDAGTEGTRYGTGPGYNFSTASLVLTWTLFDGGARQAAVGQARAARNQLASQRTQAEQQLALQLATAEEAVTTATAALEAARARATAARAAHAIVAKRRDAGLASQVEYLDARSTLTAAELGATQAGCVLLERQAELEHARGVAP